MDDFSQIQFQGVPELDDYCIDGSFGDVPLSNELMDEFSMDSYQETAPGEYHSPNPSDPDLPDNGQQSSVLPCQSKCAGSYSPHLGDRSLGAYDDIPNLHLLQQSQESHFGTDFNTSNNHPSNRAISHADERSLEKSSSQTNAQQYQAFASQPEGTLCVELQNHATTVPSDNTVEQQTPIGTPTSTQMPITPKVANNTLSTSVSANLQSSPISRPQYCVRHPSNLRNQFHPETLKDSPSATTVAKDCDSSELSYTMPSNSKSNRCQEPNASPSYQKTHSSSDGTQFCRVTSVHNQSHGSPVLQNHHPNLESSLRSSVLSNTGHNFGDAGHLRTAQYPDPRFPYASHRYVSEPQTTCIPSYSPVQYRVQPRNSEHGFLVRQGPADFSFSGSSPMSMKREISSSYSDRVVSSPILESLPASPKPQKKRRGKQEPKKDGDNEGTVDPIALQTADLTNLHPRDRGLIAVLINAMHNTDNVEDNEGMQKTWDKLRKDNALRIKEECIGLLNLTKEAQQNNGTSLSGKKSVREYESFEARFDALHKGLKTQKTMCKRLLEAPYSYGVVEDPLYAQDRVKNNRRVNHQKAEAIRLGREHLGEKGQGKGKPILRNKKRRQAQLGDIQDDQGDSGDEPASEAETDVSPRVLGLKSTRPNARTHKRTKRSTKSIQHQEHTSSAPTTPSPHSPSLEDPFPQGMLSEQDRILHGLAISQKMPTLNQSYDFQSGNEFGDMLYGETSLVGSDNDGIGLLGYEYT